MTVLLPGHRDIARHESWHCASLLRAGLAPLLVRIDNWPDEDLLGRVRIDWEAVNPSDPSVLREVLISALLAPLAEGETQVSATCWPIDADRWQDGNQRDAEQAAFLADRLKLDQIAWGRIIHEAEKRLRDPRVCALVDKITTALDIKGLLFQHELTQLAEDNA
jgi:hypothetical protein